MKTSKVSVADRPTSSYGARDASRRIRIAFVIDSLLANTGGTEGQLLHILRRLDRDRFEPRLYCLRNSAWMEENFDAAPLETLDLHLSMRFAALRGLWSFSRRLRRDRIDVIQTHFRDGNVFGVLAGKLAGVRTIISTRRGLPYWNSAIGLLFLRLLDKQVTWFIANSQATCDLYVAQEGLDETRVEVIYNGLDRSRFTGLDEAGKRALRASLGLGAAQPVIGIVANLRAVKGIDDFLHAAVTVRDSIADAAFLVFGEGPEEAKLRALVHELELDSSVHFLGSRQDVPELLQIMDLGVLSSHFESFSNTVLEYVAAGLPVVVTDVGGAREVVRDGQNGFIVPTRDPETMAAKMLEILEHPGTTRSWLEVESFDPKFELDHMVSHHERLYERLHERLAGARPRAAADGSSASRSA